MSHAPPVATPGCPQCGVTPGDGTGGCAPIVGVGVVVRSVEAHTRAGTPAKSWVCEKAPAPQTRSVCVAGAVYVKLLGRRQPTLPLPPGGSTIGAGGLSFRVRNGTGRFPAAINHRHTLWGMHGAECSAYVCNYCRPTPHVVLVCCVSDCTVDAEHMLLLVLFRGVHTHDWCAAIRVFIGVLVPVASTHYCASRSGLSTQSSSGNLK